MNPKDAFAKEASLSVCRWLPFLLPPEHRPHEKRGRSSTQTVKTGFRPLARRHPGWFF